MAQLIRSAKSGSDWTPNELYAYNISIEPTSPADFFQSDPDPSLDHLEPSVLTSAPNDIDNPSVSDQTAQYLGYLELATFSVQESAINDFAAATLKLLDFPTRQMSVSTRYSIPLTICGEQRAAHADVCLILRPSTILLVLVEDKTLFNPTAQNVDAQVVAEAIAAFQFNNYKRLLSRRSALQAMTIPCITMYGTTPTFYLVPVTKELSDAVVTGQYPTSQTLVAKCLIAAMDDSRLTMDGMADVEFRKIALKHFLAFKDLAQSHWQHYAV